MKEKCEDWGIVMEGLEWLRRLGYMKDEMRWREEKEEGEGKEEGKEGEKIDERLKRKGKNEEIMVLGRISMESEEKDWEGGEKGWERKGNIEEEEEGWIEGW